MSEGSAPARAAPPSAPVPLPDPTPAKLVRWGLLGMLAAAPLSFGAVYEAASYPLLAGSALAGLFAIARTRRMRAAGVDMPPLPGARLLLILHGIVLLQLVPLPRRVLAVVSPGSLAFRTEVALAETGQWYPVSVNPADTLRGLFFLAGIALLYLAAFRELSAPPWRGRVVRLVVALGFVMTLIALLQAASGERVIYGFFRPDYDRAIFGPYVNRNHFAGYMVMAIPLGVALVAEGMGDLRRAWGRRRKGWLALGDPEGSLVLRRGLVAMVLVLGVLASQSRGGVMAFAVSMVVLVLQLPGRRRAILVVGLVGALGLAWLGIDQLIATFETKGLWRGRLELWLDVAGLLREFGALGVGWNAFGSAYPRYQGYDQALWYGEAHNEYLQAFTDLGLPGFGCALGLVAVLFRHGVAGSRSSPLAAGVLAALAGLCAHNLVEFNWQIPANAATFAVLAGLGVRKAARGPHRPRTPLGPRLVVVDPPPPPP